MAGAAFLTQLAASSAAVAVLVGLAAWAKIARPHGPLDERRARALLALEFPGRELDALWISTDAKSAVAKSGAAALVLCALGDGFVARKIPWAQALSSHVRDGRLCIHLGEPAAPMAIIALDAWPPEQAKRGLAA